ncbi:MAG TPA: hypothetical protein VGP65_17005 [Candidatus Angelobacter sp.]|nr:hypothetical protein [Candidatus Angelobacter sp.]
MTKRLQALLMTIAALALCQGVLAQTTAQDQKHFAAQGLSFDYPAANELDDRSSTDVQHLVFQSKDRAQIMIVSRLVQIHTAEELTAARHEVVDSFVETMWNQLKQDDPNVARSPAQIEVAGLQAQGVKMRAVLDNQPGNAEVYSLQLGSRLVVLSLIGTDKEIAASAATWLAIRRSLKIAASTDASTMNLRPDTCYAGMF